MEDNNGLYIAIGQQGNGKTLLITKHAFDEKEKNPNRKIFSNYKLMGVEYTPITFNKSIEINKDKLDILEVLENDPNYFNDSIILIDEIHLYLDSLDYRGKYSRVMQTFVSQLRKRNILLLGTTQYYLNLSIRIRRQAKAIFDMERVKDKNSPYYSHFKCTTCIVDGYYYTEVSEIYLNLTEYFNKYDTKEVIL